MKQKTICLIVALLDRRIHELNKYAMNLEWSMDKLVEPYKETAKQSLDVIRISILDLMAAKEEVINEGARD